MSINVFLVLYLGRACVVYTFSLTLTLLAAKIISLCHRQRARSAGTSMQSDQALYCFLINFLNFSHFDISKIDKGQFQKWKMDKFILRNAAC